MNRKNAVSGLIILALITSFFAWQLPNMKFNYDFTMFFPKGDPDLAYYDEIRSEFGEYDDFLYLALFGNEVFNPAFLDKVDRLSKDLESWPEVDQVLSPTNHARWQVTPLGVNKINLYKKGSTNASRLLQDPKFQGLFFARDSSSVCLVIQHQNFGIKKEGDIFHQKLQAHLAQSAFEKFLVSGKIQAQDEFVQRLEQDLGFNLAMALGLVIVALALLFRSVRGVWIPLLTLVVTCIWNVGLYALTGKELDVLMVIVPPILLIVSMSDIIHLGNKFNDLVRAGNSIYQALRSAVKEVGLATFFTSITTAIGFGSLAVLPIAPIRDFGIYTAIGIIIAYLIAFSLIPCLLALLKKPLGTTSETADLWHKPLSNLFLWSFRNKGLIWSFSLVLLVMSIWGMSRVQINTSLLIGIEPDDPMAQPVQFFDKQFDGYKPFELTLQFSEKTPLFDHNTLQALDSVENYLTEVHGVKHLISPLQVIKGLNQGLRGGAQSAYAVPKAADLGRIKRLFSSSKMQEARAPIASKNGHTWRINGRSKDLGSAAYLKKNESLNQFLNGFEALGMKFRLTGTAFLIDKTNALNVKVILSGLLLAMGVIALMILLFTRDLRLTLLSIVPNALPLAIIGGLMGLLQVDLNLSTAIIFSVAFGIAVDDSIHFLSRFVLETRKGRSSLYAIKRSVLSTGKSIVLTSLILLAGFCIFLQSGFSAAYHIGFFVCTTLVVALIADLVLLPTLLYRK